MGTNPILDKSGLTYLWSKLKTLLANKADITHTHTPISVGGIPIVTATSSDGITYTATVDGVTELYAGLTIIIIPNRVSAQLRPTLNVNNLGAKNLIMPIDGVNAVISTNAAKLPTWVSANQPMEVRYDGSVWRSEIKAQSAQYMYGSVNVAGGGTGKSSVTEGSFLVGNGTDALVEKTPTEVVEHLGIEDNMIRPITVSTSEPSGGNDGDIWIVVS